MRVACIDIGTVTARLAVADVEAGRVVRLAKRSNICNLGEGVDATGALAQAAMERVFACARAYVDEARKAGAEAVCCTLTSAARDASNAWELGAALDSLGLDPLIIPGEVEGALTFLGVAQDFRDQKILVADNGGGSTELACGSLGSNGAFDLGFVTSVDVGCRRVTEKFLSGSALPSAADLAAAHEFAGAAFAPAAERLREMADEGGDVADGKAGDSSPKTLVVTGGTVTSLVAIAKELEPYDSRQVHLAGLSRQTVAELEECLAKLTVEQRAELPGLQAKRAPVMLGGAVAVAELMDRTGFDRLTVSESDLLFGLSLTAAATRAGADSPVIWKPALRELR